MAAKRKYQRRASAPKIHIPETELKLDLCCGQNVTPEHEGVDLYAPNAKHRVHLWDGNPWPWPDNSVSALACNHGIEHVDAVYIEKDGKRNDALYFFFSEAWRVSRPGATFKLSWPALQSVRAFMDMTHRRFIPMETMMYLDRNWREMQKLEHYFDRPCDFVMESCTPTTDAIKAKLADAVQQRLYIESWNFAADFTAVLRARKT